MHVLFFFFQITHEFIVQPPRANTGICKTFRKIIYTIILAQCILICINQFHPENLLKKAYGSI